MKSSGRTQTIVFAAIVVTVLAVAVGAVVAKLVLTGHQHRDTAPPVALSSTPTTPTTPTTFAAPEPSALPPLPSFTAPAGLGADCRYRTTREPASKPVKPPPAGAVSTRPAHVDVSMVTNQGNIGLVLANNESPCTVNSFVSLVDQGFFDDTSCHRLTTTPGLSVLQCGDPAGKGTGGPGYEFANEYPTDQYPPDDAKARQPVLYPRGTLAMANAGPGTNGSQFFLVYQDSELPPQYTVFGTITANGLATLDKIAKAGVRGGGQDGPPATAVTITSAATD